MQCLLSGNKLEIAVAEKNLQLGHGLNGTHLRVLGKELGDVNLIKVVYLQILSLANYFNLSNNLKDDQAIEIASLLLEKYKFESMEDILLCFRLAKQGEFGTVYNRLDGQIIFEWFSKYLDLKAQERERLLKVERQAQMENLNAAPPPELFRMFLKQLELKSDKKEEDYQKFKQQFVKSRIQERHLEEQKLIEVPENLPQTNQ